MSNDRTSLFSNNPAAIPRSQAVGGCAPGPVASAELTGLTAVFAAAADPIAIFRLPADGPAELIYHNAACAELCGRGAGGAGLVQRHDALSTLFSQASSLDAWLRSPCGGARLLELSGEGRKRQALRFVSYGRLERDGGEPLGIVRIEPVARVPAAVQERDRSYRELAEAVADGTWETDSRLRLTRLSRDARRLLGIDPEDWAGCALRSLAGTDVQAGEWQAVEDAMLAHRPFSNITVQASGARGLQWLSLSGVPLHDEDGGLLGYCGALLDVTPRIEAERRAGHAAELLCSAVEHLTDVFALWDSQDRLVVCNDGFHRRFAGEGGVLEPGTPFEAVLARAVADGLIPDARRREPLWLEERMERHRAPGQPFEERGPDDLWLLTHEKRLADGSMVTVSADITRQKAAEKRLRAGMEEAERANRSKSAFLACVSHELRTPLNAIIGFSEILTDELMGPIGSDAYREYAGNILQSGNQLLAIIDSMLDLTRIEAGRIEMQESAIDVAALVASCAAGFQDERAAQSMPLDIALPNNLPRFWGDERLLQQILANLLSNAIKFSRGGEAVELSAGIASGGGLWFEIADRGAGMSAGDVARVLQPFEQEDTSLARRYEGIGLGLPLTKAFAELHGGRMVIDSIKGEGTRVVVEFPPERCITDGGTQGRAHA